jgi:ribosomal protein S18 acetylase RimI-like enzyme
MTACTYCHANAFYRDRESGAYLCPVHARLEVTGPRGEVPRPPLTIRPATPADRLRIAELADYFWGEVEVRCFGRSYQVDVLPGEAVNLVMLNVLPQWQGRGTARGLIMALAGVAHAEGASRLIVATTNDDLLALGLYQRLGFTITGVLVGELLEHHGGVKPGFAGTPVRDEIQMELLL